jgi:hypothetical protein
VNGGGTFYSSGFILGYKCKNQSILSGLLAGFFIPGHYKFWLRWNECCAVPERKKNNDDTVEDVEYEEITTK